MNASVSAEARTRGSRLRALLHAEVLKLRNQRSLRWVVGLLVGLAGALAFATGTQEPGVLGGQRPAAHMALFTGYSIVPYVSAFLASASVAGEFGSGVARAVFTAVPARWPVIAAKAVVNVAVGVGLALASLISAALVLVAVGPVPPEAWLPHAHTWTAAAGALAGGAALALVGTAVGTLCRRVQTGVLVLVGLLLMVPPLLGSVASAAPWLGDVAGALPLTALNALVDEPSLSASGGPGWAAAACLLLWSVAAVVASRAVILRVDL